MRCIPIALVFALLISGCDQQQPIAGKPLPPPGEKPGETPPPEVDKTPLPPATAPTTPGVPNHPGAPQPLPSPPTSAPTTTPAVAP
jgi:hypothetical protein